ncbi:MAG: hypothetical protein AD073_000243 [Mycoplasmataceae bacterium]|nr:MAG: hypothetical protein AD073_000243 [Mycoplasmataceae bacterium]
MIGKTYHFSKIDIDKIKSPISGKIIKIFNDKQTVLIQNTCGLQIILRVEKKIADDFEDNNGILLCLKQNDYVKKNNDIFLIKNKEIIKRVTIYIPWQPLIIKRIDKMSVSYRNPWRKVKTKLHGDYF